LQLYIQIFSLVVARQTNCKSKCKKNIGNDACNRSRKREQNNF